MNLAMLVFTIVPGLFILAAVWDIASFTIPNVLNLALLLLFIIVTGLALIGGTELEWSDAGYHLLAGTIGLLVGMVFFATGVIGGGDAKLFAVAALWLGINALFEYALLVTLLGGLLTLSVLLFRQGPLPVIFMKYSWIQRLHDSKAGIPYGVALAGAALVTLPGTELFRFAALG
jgi:prepilin peptidase CpaA